MKAKKIDIENALFPLSSIDQTEARSFLGVVTGHDCIPCEGDFSLKTCCGHINYYDKSDGLGYSLFYEFEDYGYGFYRIKRYDIDRYEANDGMFDVTRDTLTSFLKELVSVGYDARTVMHIANHFALDV